MRVGAERTNSITGLYSRLESLSTNPSLQVKLEDGSEACVTLCIFFPPTYNQIAATGLARYTNGRAVGEQHTQTSTGSLYRPASHGPHNSSCRSFVLEAPGSGADCQAADLAVAADMIRHVVSYEKTFGVKNEETMRLAGMMRGGTPGGLFMDPALQLALDQQLK